MSLAEKAMRYIKGMIARRKIVWVNISNVMSPGLLMHIQANCQIMIILS